MTDKPHHEQATMSLGNHLEELRKRILWSIIPPLPLVVIFFLLSDSIVRWFLVPLHSVLEEHGLPTQVQVLSPPEFLIAEMKIALGGAVLTAGPWILYQLWRFVSPGHPNISSGIDENGKYIQANFELPAGSYASTLLQQLLLDPQPSM